MITAAEPIKASPDFSLPRSRSPAASSWFVDHVSFTMRISVRPSIGFGTWASNPVRSARSRSPAPTFPVIATRRGRAVRPRRPDLLRHRVAIEVGQVDVQQHHVRVGARDLRQRRAPAVDRRHRMPRQLQEQLAPRCAPRSCRRRPAPALVSCCVSVAAADLGERDRGGRLAVQRQRHHEFGAASAPLARRPDAAAVKLDQLLHQRQSDAEPPAPGVAGLGLDEGLEDPPQVGWRDAAAPVANA